MSFLPIVGRELGTAARKSSTHWMRFWSALTVLAVFGLWFYNTHFYSQRQIGQDLLIAMGVVPLALGLFAGVFLTADCLSWEKREGTLGLLFLTDLKGYDVVLGKLAANSLSACFGLLAVFPILALPLLTGGVTGQEFVRVLLALGVTLFFSLSIGLLVSAVVEQSKLALLGTLGVIVVLTGFLPSLWWLNRITRAGGWADYVLLLPSPVFTFISAFHQIAIPATDLYWLSLGCVFAIGLGALVLANVVLPRVWRKHTNTCDGGSARQGRALVRAARGSARQRTLDPFHWLAMRDRNSSRWTECLIWFVLPVWLCFLFASFTGNIKHEPPFIICFLIAYVLHLIAKIMLTSEASGAFCLGRKEGALELLLGTPLSIQSILEGQKKALGQHFRRTMMMLSTMNVIMFLTAAVFAEALHVHGNDLFYFFEMFAGGILMLLADFYALSWAGMWAGLNGVLHHRAVIRAFAQVMVVPWVVQFLMVFPRPVSEPGVVMGVWFAISVAVDIFVAQRARSKLYKQFRELASQGVCSRQSVTEVG